MSQRDVLAMTDDEVAAFLAEERRAQVATINRDGTPHVVPLSYVVLDGKLAFWTDPASQKVVNLRRDPRLTCLVEAGTEFADFRAISVTGRADVFDDPAVSLEVGLALFERATPLDDQLRAIAASMVPERVAVVVEPTRVVSWDHRKLAGVRPSEIGS